MTAPSLPAIPKNHERQWMRCRSCGWVGFYDFLPFSLQNPIRTLGCGHGAARRLHEAAEPISAEAAIIEITAKETAT